MTKKQRILSLHRKGQMSKVIADELDVDVGYVYAVLAEDRQGKRDRQAYLDAVRRRGELGQPSVSVPPPPGPAARMTITPWHVDEQGIRCREVRGL